MIQFIAPLFAIFIINSSPCKAQFPRVCAENVTAKTGVCCPSWGPGLVCGGPKRGMCLPLPDVHEIYSPARPDHMNDDRLNWPKAFFQKVCRCFGSRSGYACHECKFGYFGDDCTERRIQKRRNIMSLTRKEQQRFIGLVLKSKTSITDYVALKADWHDPVEGNVTFVNLTLHDFFVYIHYYSARHTYLRNKTHHCDNSRGHFDFSHEGSGFPTFHRLLILLWEREFQKLAEDDTFTFPYWDWVENGHHCEVCTNDLLGAVNLSDPNGHIDRRSPFSKWYTMCQTKRYNGSDCRFCNADDRFHGIVRRPVKDYRFPSLKEVDLILSKPNYDHRPYNEEAGEDTFRNCFEGGCPMPGQTYSIHNLVHAWFNGTLSGVTTSTNDPLFIVHHTMIDKLFERWMRMHKNHMTQMPEFGGPLGHHRDSVIVPMFPRFFHHMFFTDSRTLGYDYDNFDYGKHHRRDPEGYLEEEDLTSNTIVYFVTCLSFFVCLFLVMALYRENLKSTVSATYRILINRNGANNNGTLPNGNGSVKPYTDIPVKEYHDNAILQSTSDDNFSDSEDKPFIG